MHALGRANLIKEALYLTHEIDVDVSIICNGHFTNVATMNKLEANINAANLIYYFEHLKTFKPVFVILDPCYMLKLIRNVLVPISSMLDQTGRYMKWKYIT